MHFETCGFSRAPSKIVVNQIVVLPLIMETSPSLRVRGSSAFPNLRVSGGP